jgi:hypothetical protein
MKKPARMDSRLSAFGMSAKESLELKALCTSLRYPSRATLDTSWR